VQLSCARHSTLVRDPLGHSTARLRMCVQGISREREIVGYVSGEAAVAAAKEGRREGEAQSRLLPGVGPRVAPERRRRKKRLGSRSEILDREALRLRLALLFLSPPHPLATLPVPQPYHPVPTPRTPPHR
jgi:hypothetical protein